jgi:hypothetical protein
MGLKFSNDSIKNGFVNLRLEVDKNYRNQGYASKLCEYLFNTLKFNIVSDVELTNDGIKIFKTLRKQYKDLVKLYDTESGDILEYDDIPETKIYINGSNSSKISNKYRLILTRYIPTKLDESIGIPSFIEDEILKENIKFTPKQLKWI